MKAEIEYLVLKVGPTADANLYSWNQEEVLESFNRMNTPDLICGFVIAEDENIIILSTCLQYPGPGVETNEVELHDSNAIPKVLIQEEISRVTLSLS